MTLLELTEPVFQYVCRLNRAARKAGAGAGAKGDTSFLKGGGSNTAFFTKSGSSAQAGAARPMSLDYSVVRPEIKAMLEDIQQRAHSDVRLERQAEKIELPLMFFIDSLISESTL